MTKRERRRLTYEGLPVHRNDWTEDDWRDLHNAIQEAIRRISERHKAATGGGDEPGE